MRRRGPRVRMHEEKKWDVHPIWRGIGVLMIIIIPFMGFMIGTIIVESYPEFFVQLPPELTSSVNLGSLGVVTYLGAKLGMTVLITILIYSVIFIIYSIIYAVAAGNARYGPTDVTAREYRESLKEMQQRQRKKKK